MRYALLALCVALSGCDLSYDQTQRFAKYCTDRGLKVEYWSPYGAPWEVWCVDAQGNKFRARRDQ